MIGKFPLGSGSIVNAHLLAERPKPFGPPPLSAMTKRLNSDQLPAIGHARIYPKRRPVPYGDLRLHQRSGRWAADPRSLPALNLKSDERDSDFVLAMLNGAVVAHRF